MSRIVNENVIYVISFLDLLAVGLIVPLLSVHLRSLGASHLVIGIVASTYAGFQVISGPVIGSYSDVKGRKSVLIASLIFSSLLYIIFGTTQTLSVIFFVRLLLGLIKHTQTLCKAVIVDSFPHEKHGAIFGKMTALGSIGFVVGPFLGGHIYKMDHGFSLVCYLSSGLFLINLALAYTLPENNALKATEIETNDPPNIFNNLAMEIRNAIKDLFNIDWSMYGNTLALKFLFGFSTSVYFSNYSLYITEKYELSQIYIGYIISFQGTIGAMTGLLMGRINSKLYQHDINCTQRILHAFTLLSFSLTGLYFSPNIASFLLVLMPFAMASSFVRVISTEMLLTNSKDDERGTMSGTSNSVMSLSRMLAPVSSGFVHDLFGKDSVIIFALLPSLIGTLLAYKMCFTKIKVR